MQKERLCAPRSGSRSGPGASASRRRRRQPGKRQPGMGVRGGRRTRTQAAPSAAGRIVRMASLPPLRTCLSSSSCQTAVRCSAARWTSAPHAMWLWRPSSSRATSRKGRASPPRATLPATWTTFLRILNFLTQREWVDIQGCFLKPSCCESWNDGTKLMHQKDQGRGSREERKNFFPRCCSFLNKLRVYFRI